MKNYRKSGILSLLSGIALPGLLLACAAPATKMKCGELSYRLNHETLSDDQRGFLEQELKDCQQQTQDAQQQDSTTLNKFEQPFSPGTHREDSL